MDTAPLHQEGKLKTKELGSKKETQPDALSRETAGREDTKSERGFFVTQPRFDLSIMSSKQARGHCRKQAVTT